MHNVNVFELMNFLWSRIKHARTREFNINVLKLKYRKARD